MLTIYVTKIFENVAAKIITFQLQLCSVKTAKLMIEIYRTELKSKSPRQNINSCVKILMRLWQKSKAGRFRNEQAKLSGKVAGWG